MALGSPRHKSFTFGEDPKILNYLDETFHPEDSILKNLRQEIDQSDLPPIQVGPHDGLHLEVIARSTQPKKIVEIGTLGGYSGICLARALPSEGRLYTFEISASHAEFAKKAFEKAGLLDRVKIFVGPALDLLPQIENEGPFDLVFIDADKSNYPNYLKWAEEHLRIGGVVLGDNTFAFGKIGNDSYADQQEEKTVRCLREFNAGVASGGRFRGTMLPTGEGLTMGVKVK